MKNYIAVALCLFALAAHAEGVAPNYTLGSASTNLQAMESSIEQAASTGALKPQQIIALNAKQREIENLIQRLSSRKTVTPDEYSAVKLTLKQQQARLSSYEHAAMPLRRPVDPASLPPATYVTPNGATIVAPYGNTALGAVTYSGSGAVTNPAPLNMLSR